MFVAVMGAFSALAERRGWRNLEEFMNPAAAFRAVHVLSLADPYEYERVRFGSLTIHPVRPFPGGSHRSTVWKTLAGLYTIAVATLHLWRLVRRQQVDLIAQIYGGPLNFGVPVVAVAKRMGLPSVIRLQNDYPRLMQWTYPRPIRWVGDRVWRYLFDQCSAIRSVSEYIAGFPLSEGVPREKITVIPHKEEIEKFTTPPLPTELAQVARESGLADVSPESVVFLSVARLIPAKNYGGMLQAFARASENAENLHYVIAGDGPLRGKLEALADDLGIGHFVHFVGFLPHERLRSLYHLADVFCLVTHYEGQPRVLIEALLAGLPVICTDYGQVTELIRDGKDGFQVSPTDIEAIAGAIQRLAAEPELRARMGAHEAFDPQRYSVPQVSREEAAFYLSVIARHRLAQPGEKAGRAPGARADSEGESRAPVMVQR